MVDTFTEIYQFYDDSDYFGTSSSDSSVIVSTAGTEDSIEASTPEYDQSMEQQQSSTLPNGVFTDLAYCYVPTCVGKKPCYSHTCPKREVGPIKRIILGVSLIVVDRDCTSDLIVLMHVLHDLQHMHI